MKTKSLILTLAVLFTAVSSFAVKTDRPKMKIVKVEDTKALVAFESALPTHFELTISNEDHIVVYHQKSMKQQKDFKSNFNFSDLKKGTYHVCMNYGNQSLNCKVQVTNKGLKTGNVFRCYEPFFTYENGKLDVSFLNVPQKPVYLNLYRNNKHVNSTRLGKDLVIHKRINLKNLEEGKYEVVVTDEFKDHVYWVTK